MTVFTPSGISSCLCALLESELHFKESMMLILATPPHPPPEPRQTHPGHLHAAFAFSSPTLLPTDEYKEPFNFQWHNSIDRFTKNSPVILSLGSQRHTEPLAGASQSALCPAEINVSHSVILFVQMPDRAVLHTAAWFSQIHMRKLPSAPVPNKPKKQIIPSNSNIQLLALSSLG